MKQSIYNRLDHLDRRPCEEKGDETSLFMKWLDDGVCVHAMTSKLWKEHRFRVSISTLYTWLHLRGIKLRGNSQKDEIFKLFDSGMSQTHIGNRLKISRQLVSYHIMARKEEAKNSRPDGDYTLISISEVLRHTEGWKAQTDAVYSQVVKAVNSGCIVRVSFKEVGDVSIGWLQRAVGSVYLKNYHAFQMLSFINTTEEQKLLLSEMVSAAEEARRE